MHFKFTWSLFFIVALSGLQLILASSPTSFCKCSCDKNSTIIELTPFALGHLKNTLEPIDPLSLAKKPCLNCTRIFCKNALPGLCTGAAIDDEIVPLCFRKLNFV
ncbi:hypothetical protein BB561_004880 [Smittium simulii]|uniref:Uncharacterized protein n=1 Tax=Smittium simulii TaxID=133385 RepID=A0A2T9YDP6_9FUNG|nr:hypothetical protein BB561_004880 [Smittium simulii]